MTFDFTPGGDACFNKNFWSSSKAIINPISITIIIKASTVPKSVSKKRNPVDSLK